MHFQGQLKVSTWRSCIRCHTRRLRLRMLRSKFCSEAQCASNSDISPFYLYSIGVPFIINLNMSEPRPRRRDRLKESKLNPAQWFRPNPPPGEPSRDNQPSQDSVPDESLSGLWERAHQRLLREKRSLVAHYLSVCTEGRSING
jgi:hypothetical protein